MLDFYAKMHQMRFTLGRSSPRPLAGLGGPTSRGRGGVGKMDGGLKGGEGEEEGVGEGKGVGRGLERGRGIGKGKGDEVGRGWKGRGGEREGLDPLVPSVKIH